MRENNSLFKVRDLSKDRQSAEMSFIKLEPVIGISECSARNSIMSWIE